MYNTPIANIMEVWSEIINSCNCQERYESFVQMFSTHLSRGYNVQYIADPYFMPVSVAEEWSPQKMTLSTITTRDVKVTQDNHRNYRFALDMEINGDSVGDRVSSLVRQCIDNEDLQLSVKRFVNASSIAKGSNRGPTKARAVVLFSPTMSNFNFSGSTRSGHLSSIRESSWAVYESGFHLEGGFNIEVMDRQSIAVQGVKVQSDKDTVYFSGKGLAEYAELTDEGVLVTRPKTKDYLTSGMYGVLSKEERDLVQMVDPDYRLLCLEDHGLFPLEFLSKRC